MPDNPYGSFQEQLVRRFRTWERRGRGWALYPYACELEPPFRPFEGHFYVRAPFVDDGRRSGVLLSSLFGRPEPEPPTLPEPWELEEEEPSPPECAALPGEPCELQVLLSEDFGTSADAAEQFLASLSFSTYPVGLELIAYSGSISLQFTSHTQDRPQLFHQLQALAPSAALIPREGFLASEWLKVGEESLIVDLGLAREFVRPLRGLRTFSSDPLSSLLAALAGIAPGEIAVVQCLFQAARNPWHENILRLIHDNEGKPFPFLGAELTPQAKEKIRKPLFACRLRLGIKARSEARRMQLLRLLMGGFAQFAAPPSNELIALDGEDWDDEEKEEDLLFRVNHRSGMLLNLEELAGLAHLPAPRTLSPKFERLTRRTKAAPESVRRAGVLLGANEHMGERTPVRLGSDARLRHVYVIGGTGTGKSTLLLNLALQDVEEGRGLAVLDPHGDLVDEIVARMPETRIRDVVLLDPADEEYPIGFNILSAHSDLERILLSSDLVAVFRRLSTSWGDQMTAVLGNAILAFLESSVGGTLLELRRFLVDPTFRASFLKTVRDPEVTFFWQREYPLLKGSPQAPLLTRLDAFLRPKLIRNMVSQRESALDFRRIMDERKILLCKLSQGAIGEENAYLLGALIVAKLQQLASSRQELASELRAEFFLYLDEFQHFITPSVSALLSGVRKYRMGLILAHQNLTQLGAKGDGLVDSVLANAGTRICFRLGDSDARMLSGGFSFFEAPDFQNLGIGEAICRVDRSEDDFNLRTEEAGTLDPQVSSSRTRAVISSSRQQWATLRAEPLPPEIIPQVDTPPEKEGTLEAPAVTLPSTPPPRDERKAPRVEVPTPGRGGQQHKYLQSLVKHIAEDRGFRASIEETVLGGHGSIDVLLERADLRIAVEIGITTPTAHELQNIQKCLAAGVDRVLWVCAEKKFARRMDRAIRDALVPEQVERVTLLGPEDVPGYLDTLTLPEPSTQTIAGYKVAVEYEAPEEAEKKGKMDTIREIIASSLKRSRPPE